MRTVQRVLVCALLAALTLLAVSAVFFVRAATATVASMPAEVDSARLAAVAEIDAARTDLTGQIATARRDLLTRSEREIAALRTDVMAQADEFRGTADGRIGDTLARVDTALGTVEALRRDLEPALRNSGAVAAQVNDALPLFLDCDHNADCVFNRYVGASKGIEHASANFAQMSQDASGALPKMLLTWNRIGTDISGTAGNLNRLTKPHWYDRLIGYGLNGVIMYRNLNPVTNLTIKGAQLVSGR